jgi:ABC-2 type transport system ATP-binding protein
MTAVDIRNLSKSYGAVPAVRDLTFTADYGEILALVGPDGAGKTTAFRLTCGLMEPDSGTVTIAGLNVAVALDSIKPRLGYMPQVFALYTDLSVEENLRFYAGLFGVKGENLKTKMETLYTFSGLGPFSKRRAGELSGGMKQKLALSCALIHDPEILILDEPTTGVDPLSRQQFWDILKGVRAGGAAVMVSTPYMDEAAMAGRVIFVHDGRKVAEGTPDDLRSRYAGNVYSARVEPTRALVDGLNRIPGLAARRVGAAIRIYTRAGATVEAYYDRMAPLGVGADVVERIPPDLADVFIQMIGAGEATSWNPQSQHKV